MIFRDQASEGKGRTMVRNGLRLIGSALSIAVLASPAVGDPGWFLGSDVGVSEPVNGNYRAHVHTGATANPYVGYMFHDNIGLQTQLQFAVQPPDDDDRGFAANGINKDESDVTSVFGLMLGPRLAIPVWDIRSPKFIRGMEVYITGQGGLVEGMSGRMEKTSGGYSVGGGLDFYLDDNWAVSFFGRWNEAFQSPRPITIPDNPTQSPGEQGPHNAEWASVGIGIKYDFRKPPEPPAMVCPECVCPKCPVTRKVLLRSITFDFDEATLRPDAAPILDEAIRIMGEQEGDFAIILEGHTDSIGNASYNQELSERRADAVRNYLVDHGVASEKIRSVGFGETRPVADNSTPEGRARNRRVDQHLE
jgi:outer membrane protein OmpA-like peptidoglycan-associated protein